MLFQSWTFLAFFLLAFAGHLVLRRTRLRIPWLLLASYAFYASWEPLWCVILAWVTLGTFAAVWLMERTGWRRLWLWLTVLNGVGTLGTFKYARFVTENINALLERLGSSLSVPEPGWAFPVGISFFSFTAIAYAVDVYRGDSVRERNLLRFAAFLAFFPKLMMGPIERGGNLLPQLGRPGRISAVDVADGLSLFVVGLFKKVALADYLALYVNPVYDAPGEHGAAALLLASFAFAWQIYFDFSGYTDMARGLGRAMGYRLMLNFNNPYLADGLGNFWRRWHISLSTWFRDYVYIPLGGNRHGRFRTYLNMSITMVVSGLWHGAAWTFVIWGAVHAAARVCTRELERTPFYRQRVPRFVKQLAVFVVVTFAWVFFRANSLGDAVTVIRRMFTTGWRDPRFPLAAALMVLSVWVYQFAYESRLRRVIEWAPVRVALVIAMLVYLAVFAGGQAQAFIYLQF
jgi:D-alanyl-lipoteichoic acid acyltransferase DltB (MBOAT superfamily)